MGTFTITASGFSALSQTAPDQWPSFITWPAGGNPNGSKTFTISDADWVSLLTWIAISQFNKSSNSSPSAPQLLLAFAQWLAAATQSSVQRTLTVQAIPPQITMT